MITRFAPSPTGPLHIGHAFSALTAWDRAGPEGFRLRIEDLDRERSKPEWEALIYDDLAWLGLSWPTPLRQSDQDYGAALAQLAPFTYGCRCNRRDIAEATRAPHGAPMGPDGVVYPGTCRGRPIATEDAIRLDIARAAQAVGDLQWLDNGAPRRASATWLAAHVGDVVLRRRGNAGTPGAIAYHLAVTVDDARQGITDVIRGADLAPATAIHVLLQRLLDLPTPNYHHHRLICDESGKRLAKRDDARALRLYRAEGATPADIRALIDLPAPTDMPSSEEKYPGGRP